MSNGQNMLLNFTSLTGSSLRSRWEAQTSDPQVPSLNSNAGGEIPNSPQNQSRPGLDGWWGSGGVGRGGWEGCSSPSLQREPPEGMREPQADGSQPQGHSRRRTMLCLGEVAWGPFVLAPPTPGL